MHRGTGTRPSHLKSQYAGELQLLHAVDQKVLATRRVYSDHDLNVGRDKSRCQWVLTDPKLSAKHLRIYTIVYDNEDEGQLEKLVYAEDLSRYGTYWNESLIGKGNGGFLLSHNDQIRLSSETTFRFVMPKQHVEDNYFDLVQEKEMTHFRHEYAVTDRLLGSGSFGKVFMAIEQHTRTQVACKVVDLRKLKYTTSAYFSDTKQPLPAKHVNQRVETEQIKSWAARNRKSSQLEEKLNVYYREVNILSELSHPNIISLDKVYITDNTMYIFQDLVTAGDLFSYLESKNGRLAEVEAAVILRQILIALQFLHSHDIVHRDLKPENILMTSLSAGCRVVLTDFGAARRVGRDKRMGSILGSLPYAAPEISKGNQYGVSIRPGYTKAVDMWSVGAIAVVLLTGGSAFSDPLTGSFSPVLARTGNLSSLKRSKEWKSLSTRPQSFIADLLVVNEQHRLPVQQALQHTWFYNEIHKTDFEELYQRTIKNWRPRVVKNPVTEFIQSSFVRHLEPWRSFAEEKKRSRPERKPINPPYRPFPRNMHVQLWPQRKTPSQTMSEEVRNAIDNNWTGDIKRLPSRFKSPMQLKQIIESNLPLLFVKAEKRGVDAASGGTPKGKFNITTQRAQSAPPVESRIEPDAASLMDENTSNILQIAKISVTIRQRKLLELSSLDASLNVQPQTSSDNVKSPFVSRSRGLRQRPHERDNSKMVTKRRLDSVYDMYDEESNEVSSREVSKRSKLERTKSSVRTKAVHHLVMAHSAHAVLNTEAVEQNCDEASLKKTTQFDA